MDAVTADSSVASTDVTSVVADETAAAADAEDVNSNAVSLGGVSHSCRITLTETGGLTIESDGE